MQPKPASSYDEVPYDARPRASTHPDTLATLATLLGMQPAPVQNCRMLELGCATGGNLLPLADALPDSEFVGIDLSARQIDMGRQVVAALGLSNLHLEEHSILDIDESIGKFDYIICHGVYSWVAEAVRDAILRQCQRLLTPQGIAYISYNTYPGWYRRAPIRDMMNYHVRDMESAQQRASQARAFLQFFQQALPDPDSTWARLVREESESILPEGDYYLIHEHLDANNHAVYFHEFIEHAQRHGLQYLGEAGTHLTLASYPPEVQQVLQQISSDLLALEQYVDFLKCRSFRRTLLVHGNVKLRRDPPPEILDRFVLAGLCRPTLEKANIFSSEVVEFRNEHDATVETNIPITKTALVVLYDAWPGNLSFAELWHRARQRLATEGVIVADETKAGLAGALVQLFLSGLVGLHTYVPPFVSVASDRPMTTPLVRLQASSGAPVCNRRHRVLDLLGLDRAVLTQLDGEHDRAAILEGLVAQVREQQFEMRRDGVVVSDPAGIREILAIELEEALGRLASAALLIR